MHKILFQVLFFLSVFVHAQQTDDSFDTFYSNVKDDMAIENFKDVYIKEFKFDNPIFDLELKFQPTTNYNAYQSNFWHGNFSKISKYVKYNYSTEKRLEETIVYNDEGLKVSESASGNSNFFFYDKNNRMNRWVRVVRGDTLYTKSFFYNNKSQLIKHLYSNYSNSKKTNTIETQIAYDVKNRPISMAQPTANGGLEYSKKVIYDGNIVKVESWYKGKINSVDVMVFSKNYNLIKHVFSNYTQFSSYNANKQITKQTTFINNKLNYVRNYQYNENKDLVLSTYETPADRAKKELRTTVYKYDEKSNKIHEFTSDNISINTFEYFYEIAY
uniref:hypothetical protein n=1 Tax=Flavobacterium sp. TaxID=239 RepID=UPI0040490F44